MIVQSSSIENSTFMTAEDQDPASNVCLNCQSVLEGSFCSQCGQAQKMRLVPIKDWLVDFLGTFLNLDSKLLRTMKHILIQPGQATVDFGKGHRVPYTGPAKVYIIVSAISIAAMTLWGAFSQNAVVPGLSVDEGLMKRVQFLFPFFNLFSPFVTAGILAVFHRRFYFQLHLAFSLHFWSFLVALATPLIFIPPTSVWSLIAFLFYSVIGATYLFLAHLRVYAVPMPQRIVTCGLVLLSLPIATIVITALLFTLAAMIG